MSNLAAISGYLTRLRTELDGLEHAIALELGEAAASPSGPWETVPVEHSPSIVPAVPSGALEAPPGSFAAIEAAHRAALELAASGHAAAHAPAPAPAHAAPRPRYRVVYANGSQVLPGVIDQLCIAGTPAEAQVLLGVIERQFPGWQNRLAVVSWSAG